jgi:hypothetical protein
MYASIDGEAVATPFGKKMHYANARVHKGFHSKQSTTLFPISNGVLCWLCHINFFYVVSIIPSMIHPIKKAKWYIRKDQVTGDSEVIFQEPSHRLGGTVT